MNEQAIAAALVFVPLIVGVVQAIKTAFSPPGRFVPLIAVGVGTTITVGGSIAAPHAAGNPSIFSQIIAGIVLGLASSGLYEAAPRIVAPSDSKPPNG